MNDKSYQWGQSLQGNAHCRLILIADGTCLPALTPYFQFPAPQILRRRKKLRVIPSLGWFSHPVSRGFCRHQITPSGHPFPSKISEQCIYLCVESTWHAFMENPALSWHSSKIPSLKSLTFFFFFFTTEQWTFTQSLKSHLPPYFSPSQF